MQVGMLLAGKTQIHFLTQVYEVKSTGNEVNKVTNVISEFMYVQCNFDWYKYLILNSFIDYKEYNKAVASLTRKLLLKVSPVSASQ